MTFPHYFTAQSLQTTLGDNYTLLLIVYTILSLVRAVFFIPSTVLVIIGVALFPTQPFLVLLISLLGILTGASIVYLASNFLQPEFLLKEKQIKKMEIVREKMNRYGFGIVLLWSFFPAVPTDLICYIAGVIRMSYIKFIAAVFIGELILVGIYVYTGQSIIQFLL